ncbi:LOW QUALITY PROTEIN: nuclear control of ATPase protein 2-like [Aphis gossypii]|uniref:LOW QUALITY PROTEIN: nuclear control of ATPase protein 2-like n=1 Tax=Aphis gossypii TaxID=80765 RepID=UPI00215984F6|nr:LOW QUALITY PROTEIN: nuclear control of ATPase protein 2-like [Aphis gossypii]
MKSSLVIASVLLAGVALGVNAYRINNNNNNNQDENHNQWSRFQQSDFSAESLNQEPNFFDQQTAGSRLNHDNEQFNKRIVSNNDNSESTFTDRQYQNSQYDETHFDFNENQQQQQQQQQQTTTTQQQQQQDQQQQYGNQNQATSGQFSGLAKKIADKVAAIQQIAVNHNIAYNVNYLNGALEVARDSVKLSANNFVSFYNTTMKNLDNGDLEYMYLNLEKDTCFAQYHFSQIETTGSFKSDVRDARSGYYTIVMNNVYSNLTTSFYDDQHSVVRSAKFQNADANIKTQDGSETQVFNPALQRFLGVLAKAVSNEVKMSARSTALVQIKNEIRKPIYYQNQNTENTKLFDLVWQEDNVAMEMRNIGFGNSKLASATEQLFKSMTFQRKSPDSYTMRYDFALNDLEWISPLTVMSAGKRTTTPPTKFNVDKINVQVFFDKSSFNQQESCDKISVNTDVRGLTFNLDNNLRSEVVSVIENKLERFIQHSLGSYIQKTLKQNVCNNNYYKY